MKKSEAEVIKSLLQFSKDLKAKKNKELVELRNKLQFDKSPSEKYRELGIEVVYVK